MSSARKILVVDDSTDLLEAYEAILEMEGFEIRSATSVDGAIAILKAWRPDLILTDIIMPVKTGFELITHVRSDLVPPVPPIVALSGFPDVEGEALRRGASALLVKPVGMSELVEVIRSMLAGEFAPTMRAHEAHAVAQRRGTIAAAEKMVAEILTAHPDLAERSRVAVGQISTYFEHRLVAILLLSGGHLRVLSSSHPDQLSDGAIADEILGRAVDVIASGSSLVIADEDVATVLGMARELESRPLASARLVAGTGAVVGNIAVFGGLESPFDAVDLSILEYIARHSSAVFAAPEERPIDVAPYVVREEHWRYFLQQELAHLRGRSLVLALMDTLRALSASAAGDLGATFASRMALTQLGDLRMGLFHLAHTVDSAQNAVAYTVAAIHKEIGLRGAAILAFDQIELQNTADSLLDIAEVNLRATARLGEGTVWTATLKPELIRIDEIRSWSRRP